MANYNIRSEIIDDLPPPFKNTSKDTYTGLLMHIQPPVSLNSDAVDRWYAHNDLEPITKEDEDPSFPDDVKNVLLLGSTKEQTTIYALVEKSDDGGREASKWAVEHLGKLVTVMSIGTDTQVTIDEPQHRTWGDGQARTEQVGE
jgi:hypothetical protein